MAASGEGSVACYYPPLQDGVPFPYCSQGGLATQGLPKTTQNLPADPRTAYAPPQQPVQLGHYAPDAAQSHYSQTLMSPSFSSSGEAASAQGSPWSVPDNDTDFDSYSYQGSPLSAAAYNTHAPISPDSWVSPIQNFRQVNDHPSNNGFHPARRCSPAENGSPHAMPQNMYSHTSHPYAATPAHSPHMGMPPSSMSGYFAPPSPGTMSQGENYLELEDEGDESGDGRNHEPYSKQIERCLKTFPRYSATVQQIYDWFERNTDRSRHQGWKNSVRHNLSLNQVR